MPFATVYHEDTQTNEATYPGVVTAGEVIEVMKAMTGLSLQHGCYNWLADFTHARTSVETFEIYQFPEKIAEITLPLGEHRFRVRRAIVGAPSAGDFGFAATVSYNRGQSLKVFRLLDEAREWFRNAG